MEIKCIKCNGSGINTGTLPASVCEKCEGVGKIEDWICQKCKKEIMEEHPYIFENNKICKECYYNIIKNGK